MRPRPSEVIAWLLGALVGLALLGGVIYIALIAAEEASTENWPKATFFLVLWYIIMEGIRSWLKDTKKE